MLDKGDCVWLYRNTMKIKALHAVNSNNNPVSATGPELLA